MPPGGAVQKVTAYPEYFHSQNNPSCGQTPQPPLSAAATSSSSGPMNRLQSLIQPRMPEAKG
eukprot:4026761-Prorocentrum_lima.AAC.1